MLDINFIREQPEVLRKALTDRQMDSSVVDKLITLDAERRSLLVKVENLKAQRNAVSKSSRVKTPPPGRKKIDAMRSVGEEIAKLDETSKEVDEGLQALLATIPNLPDLFHACRKRREREYRATYTRIAAQVQFCPPAALGTGTQDGIDRF